MGMTAPSQACGSTSFSLHKLNEAGRVILRMFVTSMFNSVPNSYGLASM
jgi:hypothetical protein